MSVKHSLNYLTWVYNTISDKLELMLYHRVLASLTNGKRTVDGYKCSCFISLNDLIEVVPEIYYIDTPEEVTKLKFKIQDILNKVFQEDLFVNIHDYLYYDKIIISGITITYIDKG